MIFKLGDDVLLLGACEVKAEDLCNWALSKGVKPEYAKLAVNFVDSFRYLNVRGDIAFCQSLLETGFFKFGNDVKPEQHNYAGIGASGGGVPGDSFESPFEGIHAQLQNLALRSGVVIAKSSIISPYVAKHYSTISSYNFTKWKQLAGSWAADLNYWTKIQNIMYEFNKWKYANNPPKEVPQGDKFILHCVSQKAQRIAESLMAFSPMEFVRIGESATNPPEEQPKEPLAGKTVFLDIGHGITGQQTYDSGAIGPNGEHEHVLNIAQAEAAKAYLVERGATVKLGKYTAKGSGVDLETRGKLAKGCDCFVSCHLNAANKTAEYSVALIHSHATEADKKLAACIALETSKVKGEPNKGAAAWSDFSVLVGAKSVGVPACISEACFLDSPGEIWPNDANLFGEAIGKGISAFLLSM